ncbi:MAG: hypothetical protein ACRDD2_07460 [Sarcina sp.]
MDKKTKLLIGFIIVILISVFGLLIVKAYNFDKARETQIAPYNYIDSTLINDIYSNSVIYLKDQNKSNDYNLQLAITFAIRNNLEDFNLKDFNNYKFFINNKKVTEADRHGTGFTVSIGKLVGNDSLDQYAHIEFIKTKNM